MNTPNTNYAAAGYVHAEPSLRASRQERLEKDIDRQRDHIGGLLDAIESKLSPGEMFERVLGYSKNGGREFASNLGDTVKANPMPTLLAAAGLVWLYANKDSTTRTQGLQDGSYDRADDNDADDDSGIRQRARDAREGLSAKAGDAKDRASDAAHDAMDTARDKSRRANEGFHHMLEDNPMAIGAMGIAVGALLGAMLPSTRKEDELLGETSDDLADEAKSLAKFGFNHATRVSKDLTTPRGQATQARDHQHRA